MARITRPLTNTEVKQAKPKDKQYTLSDGGGLFLRVRPNGAKNWMFDYYQPFTKKRSVLSFGAYPSVSIADARNKRSDAKTLLAQDIDPKQHRDSNIQLQQEANGNTLQVIAEKWFAVKKSQVTPDYAEDIWRSLNLHIFPSLGKVPIEQIKATVVIETIKPIAAKGNLETVKRLCQRLNEVATFAVNTGVIHSNPLSGIKAAFAAPKKNHMPTLKPAELPKLMRALSTASITTTTRCLIHWQLHSMARPSETAGARWDEIDFDNKLWNIPASRMKKNKPHSVPLTPATLELLEIMRPISARHEFIFPSDRIPNKHINEQTANAALKRMGFSGILVAHGLRALASTTLNEQGFDPDVIEAALAHVDKNEVRRAYNRAEYLEKRRELMTWWSNHIVAASQHVLI
ncbi:integrase domain-containing protein [Photobacterium chitinilyticum]|uniref:DUF4102 domain-containing protein n=1 Tax=Photobacterium chitinilyticum TaxID=2485123 RepID=A0A3S3SX45_9GAMM|nr:integrase domain-containing protein [Photobacterium chitinilyticum]RWX54089.1 DUF4102 domain-containing protein [Photobacterium chitinilyticum]